MNKRIRELALQAGYQEDMFGAGHWHMPECKQFAKLIIEECIEIIQDEYVQGANRNADYCLACYEIYREIKDRFELE